MQSLRYNNSSDAPPSSVSLDWVFSDGNDNGSQGDGGALDALGTTTVNIIAVNDEPTVDLDSATTGVDYTTEFVVGGSPVALANGGSISDVDGVIQTLTVTLTNSASSEIIASAPVSGIDGITNSLGVTTFTNTGSATNQDFQTLLDSLTYNLSLIHI